MKICVSVNTPPALREFIISRNNGCDTISLSNSDVFSSKIIELLKCPPRKYWPLQFNDYEVIKIEIESFNIADNTYLGIYRNYLSEGDQYEIVEEWNNTFKEIFHNYVLGFCRGMDFKIPCQKKAFLSFLDDYDIPMENVNLDTLKKSWDRSKQKKKHIFKFKRACYELTHKNS